MDSRAAEPSETPTQRYFCPDCRLETSSTILDPSCTQCGRSLKEEFYASTILSPREAKLDETLTAILAAPLPDEVQHRSQNPSNLFGKYILLREIGRGATGTVLEAWDSYLSRHVALKFLHSSARPGVELSDLQRVQDFLREARLAARLQHPNIVQIHEVDCRDGRYFISMDYIDGGTLAERIHGPADARVRTRFYLEPRRFLKLLRTIALAVHHAHRQDPPVVHRDLKPQNVLIGVGGKPTVADFGIANEVQAEGVERGGIRGTPAYMAPEQALGHTSDIDPRTDVYSLGVILYEMLTGEAPFKGENIPSVLRKVVTDPPEPPSDVVARLLQKSKEVAACPAEMRRDLDALCLKALAKDREGRHKSALEFADALAVWTRDADPQKPATRRVVAGTRWRLAGVAAAVLALVAFALPWRLSSTSPAAAVAGGPGDDLAQLAAGYQAAGQWPPFRAAVAELQRKAPGHPRLKDYEAAIAGRDVALDKACRDWASRLEGLSAGAEVEPLRASLREFPELEDDFRVDFRKALIRLETSLVEDARKTAAGGRGEAWTSKETKTQAELLRRKMTELRFSADDPDDGIDVRPLSEGIQLLDQVLAYQGTWTLRINVTPFAEFRILEENVEKARDFTPAAIRSLEIARSGAVLEMCWPSIQDPQRRWSSHLPRLNPGDTIVVSGDLQQPLLRVEPQ